MFEVHMFGDSLACLNCASHQIGWLHHLIPGPGKDGEVGWLFGPLVCRKMLHKYPMPTHHRVPACMHLEHLAIFNRIPPSNVFMNTMVCWLARCMVSKFHMSKQGVCKLSYVYVQ